MDKVKVTISREDGSPICPREEEPCSIFLTDVSPLLVVKKDGRTVESISGDISVLLEVIVRELEALGVKERQGLCKAYGLTLQTSKTF